jgi:LPS-assembly protein
MLTTEAASSMKTGLRKILSCFLLLHFNFVLFCHNGDAQEIPNLKLESSTASDRVRTEIPYQGATVILLSDFQERISKTRYRANGHVQVTYRNAALTCDELEYDEETGIVETTGITHFTQGSQYLTCSRAKYNFASQTGVFYDADGFTDREFLIKGRTIFKTGSDTYKVDEGFVTSCMERKPKWSFETSRAGLRVDHTARLRNVIFRIKGVPVVYFPYVVLPMEKKQRSSGFLPFHTGSSTSKGRIFNQGYFQTLGSSADLTAYGDYFSLRGVGLGGIFRAKPNNTTHLYLQAYGIHDKLGQGGAHLVVDGDSILKDDWRIVARANITSNFQFRQAFSDSFRAATISQEQAVTFLTRNHRGCSTNISFQREEVFFAARSVVVRKVPSLGYSCLGLPIGRTPLTFYLESSLAGLSRADVNLTTPRIVQRLDLYPRLALKLPSFAGFSLLPSAGIRETYYGAHQTDQNTPALVTESLHRRYADFELELRTPTLEKQYSSSLLGDFKHVIEPFATYRRIHGVDNLKEIIRYDEEDAIADTNEIEYGIINRIFRNRASSTGRQDAFEFMSLALKQKYFFDPTFGGAFQVGRLNTFYPLDGLTGFSATAIERSTSPAALTFRLTPTPGISHDVRADFDMKYQRFRDASLSTHWQQGKLYVAGTYLKTNALEPEMSESHHIQGQAAYGQMTAGLSTSVTLSYNIQTAKLLNSHTRINYTWNCCGVTVEFQQFDLGQRIESRFSLSFTLKGIGSFGNVERPESLF